MALTDGEIWRCKAELGFNLLEVGSEPYIGFVSIFNQVIQLYLSAGASTTSATAITAATSPTLATLTLTSGTGFHAFDRVSVDVDDSQEWATVRTVSGATITCFLSKAHSGTYPVCVEGGESIVREILNDIRKARSDLSAVEGGAGMLKKVDEVEFYNGGYGTTQLSGVESKLMILRQYLASAFGLQDMWSQRRSAGSRMAVY